MIKIGTDICSIKRLQSAYDRFGERLLNKILTDSEIQYVLRNPSHVYSRLAGRFAAKEAASKVLGTGWRGISFKEIEVLREPSGAPVLKLTGRAEALANNLGLTRWEVSLSHEREYALASVLAYGAGH